MKLNTRRPGLAHFKSYCRTWVLVLLGSQNNFPLKSIQTNYHSFHSSITLRIIISKYFTFSFRNNFLNVFSPIIQMVLEVSNDIAFLQKCASFAQFLYFEFNAFRVLILFGFSAKFITLSVFSVVGQTRTNKSKTAAGAVARSII